MLATAGKEDKIGIWTLSGEPIGVLGLTTWSPQHIIVSDPQAPQPPLIFRTLLPPKVALTLQRERWMQDKIEHGAREKMKIRFDQVARCNIRQQKVQAHPTPLLQYFATRATATRSHYRSRGPAATKPGYPSSSAATAVRAGGD